MNTLSALQSGLSGVQSGMKSLKQNAAKIASNSLPQNENMSITDPLINMIQDKQQIQASAKVIEASNSMLGSILDIKV